jgi:hypothetical protein
MPAPKTIIPANYYFENNRQMVEQLGDQISRFMQLRVDYSKSLEPVKFSPPF